MRLEAVKSTDTCSPALRLPGVMQDFQDKLQPSSTNSKEAKSSPRRPFTSARPSCRLDLEALGLECRVQAVHSLLQAVSK